MHRAVVSFAEPNVAPRGVAADSSAKPHERLGASVTKVANRSTMAFGSVISGLYRGYLTVKQNLGADDRENLLSERLSEDNHGDAGELELEGHPDAAEWRELNEQWSQIAAAITQRQKNSGDSSQSTCPETPTTTEPTESRGATPDNYHSPRPGGWTETLQQTLGEACWATNDGSEAEWDRLINRTVEGQKDSDDPTSSGRPETSVKVDPQKLFDVPLPVVLRR